MATLKEWLENEIVSADRMKNTSQTDARATFYTGRLQALKDALAQVVEVDVKPLLPGMTRIERQKHDMLLAWFNTVVNDIECQGRVSMDDFDRRYRWLFGKRPLFYSWGLFYRDHGFAGVRQHGNTLQD